MGAFVVEGARVVLADRVEPVSVRVEGGVITGIDVARDGALSGPNIDLYQQCVHRFPSVAWQASGGVSAAADLHALAVTGAAAVISGRALLEGRIPAEELTPFLPAA